MKQINIFAQNVETEALKQFYKAMALPCNIAGALMPDAHTGYTLPIGAVIKTKNRIFPSYVGYDIGCGVASMQLNLNSRIINTGTLNKIKDEILKEIPIGVCAHKNKREWGGYKNATKDTINLFTSTGTYQLGSLGGGNHFLEIGKDKENSIWITVHSGSRGFGYKIAELYMRKVAVESTDKDRYAKQFIENNNWRKHDVEKWEAYKEEFIYRKVWARLKTNLEGHYSADINSEVGKNYITDMNIALEFALENRKIMLNTVKKIIEKVINKKIKTLVFINSNHNHAVVEENGFVLHRKGATQASKGMLGVIPANMHDGCFVVKGKGNALALNSSSHGAGRLLSRRKAKDTLNFDELKEDMLDIVNNITESTIDEAPGAYKNIYEVLELQKDMVEVLHHVTPMLNIKG